MKTKQGTGVGIVGMGIALPENVRTNDWWSKAFHDEHSHRARTDLTTQADQVAPRKTDPEVARYASMHASDVFRGTKERRVTADGDEPSDLEARAAARALESANMSSDEVDLLLVYSVLPDVPAPLNHPLVAHKLRLRRDTSCMTLAVGCASFVSQLFVASRLIEAGDYRTALIVQSSVMSRIIDEQAPSSVNVGDGAVAAVLHRVDEGFGFIAHHQDTQGKLHAGIRLSAADQPCVPWYRGDLHGAPLRVQATDLAASLVMGTRPATFCRETCSRVLKEAGYDASDVDFFCLSQPTTWFGKACCDAMGIAHERTLDTFCEYAHLMAASAPLNLWTAYERGRLNRDDLILIYSPGAGFIQSALLYRWNLPAPNPAARGAPVGKTAP